MAELCVLGHEEKILRLQVTMANVVLMHVVDGTWKYWQSGRPLRLRNDRTAKTQVTADDLLHQDGRLDLQSGREGMTIHDTCVAMWQRTRNLLAEPQRSDQIQ